MNRGRFRRIVGALALVCLVGSCTGTSDGTNAVDTSSSSAGASTVDADAIENERQIEELTAACMRGLGFEYQLDGAAVAARAGTVDQLSDLDYASTYGFGISTLQTGADTGSTTSDEEDGGSEAPATTGDPNAAYVETLGPQGASSWNIALYGDPSGSHGGCYDTAIERVFGSQHPTSTDVNGLALATERAQADPDMVALHRTWSECMSDNGYVYAKPIDMYLDINEQLASLGDTSAPSPELDDLRTYEVGVAVAAVGCNAAIADAYDDIVARYADS